MEYDKKNLLQTAKFLQEISIFKSKSTAQLEILSEKVKLIRYKKGDVLIKDGEIPKFLYICKEGIIHGEK